MKNICVFCGSSPGEREEYVTAARQLGSLLAQRGLTLVYGGGNSGLMGEIARAALQADGKVIGVIPRSMEQRELAHRGVTELHVVDNMHQRKAMMAELADGFIAMPGGLLNVGGYYDTLALFLDHMVAEGFLHPQHRALALVSADPQELLDQFERYTPTHVDKIAMAHKKRVV
jgi:predicted Rossmann-fold nucleotide-binding protein